MNCRRPRQPLVPALVAISLVWTAPCAAVPTIDQSHIITQSVGGLITVADFTPSQTFTVGLTGALSQIDVQIGRDAAATDDLTLEIWSTAGGVPTGTSPLYATSIPASAVPVGSPSASLPFTMIDVTGANLLVAPGQVYAVAVRGTPGFDDPHAFWNWGNPGYSGGDPYSSAFGRPWEQDSDDFDFGFRTWVDSSPSLTQTVEFTPVFDAAAEFVSGVGFVVTDGNDSISIRRVSFLDEDERGVLEFDLSSIPGNATIESASLQFDITQRTFGQEEFPIVELYGYAGDGQLHPADAADLSNLLGTSAQIDSFDTVEVNVDPAKLSDLRFASDHLGLVAYQRISPHDVHMAASELAAAFPGSYIAPTLSITFAVPPHLPPRAGDYNGNGIEDAADYTVWRDSLGKSGDGLAADGNGDRTVDVHDYAIWKNAFINRPPPGVRNGDFATGELSEWDVVVEPNTNVSVGFPRIELFDVDGDGSSDEAMRIRLGRIDPGLNQGGKAGIEQEVLILESGDYLLSAEFAAASFQDFGNTAAGRFELLFDDTLVDFVDLNGTLIDAFEIVRGMLESQLTGVAAGYHTIGLMVHRPATNSREIYQYYDNITLVPLLSDATASHRTPEPTSCVLVLLAATGMSLRPNRAVRSRQHFAR